MYKTIRATGKFSYQVIETIFENHQKVWPETLFNEDAQFKYIDPLAVGTPNENNEIVKTDAYLDMLQGSKAEQRKWWLYNRFKYLDSKYIAGEAASDVITLRAYAKDDITVTPFNDIYVDIKYANTLGQQRGQANVPTTIPCTVDELNDSECYIYSASQLKSVSDLTGLKVGYADFGYATKLQTLTVHDDSENPNYNMTNLGLGSNVLLKTIICKDCPNLTRTIDLSNCSSIQTANFANTGITGVSLANGAGIQTLILPSTITNLTLRNTVNLSTLTIGDDTDYSSIVTLQVENVEMFTEDFEFLSTILDDMTDNSRIRLIGLDIDFDSVDDISDFEAVLDRFRGLDESGTTTTNAQVSGTIHLDGTISYGQIATFVDKYPYLMIDADRIIKVVDNELVYMADTIPANMPTFDLDLTDGHIYMTGSNDIFQSGESDEDSHMKVTM